MTLKPWFGHFLRAARSTASCVVRCARSWRYAPQRRTGCTVPPGIAQHALIAISSNNCTSTRADRRASISCDVAARRAAAATASDNERCPCCAGTLIKDLVQDDVIGELQKGALCTSERINFFLVSKTKTLERPPIYINLEKKKNLEIWPCAAVHFAALLLLGGS